MSVNSNYAGIDSTWVNRKYHPVVDNFKFNFHAFIRNRAGMAGAIITVFFYFFTLLDYVYPGYLGVPNDQTIYQFAATYGGLGIVSNPTAPGFMHGWQYILGATEFNIPLLPVMLGALKYDLTNATFVVLVSSTIGIVVGVFSGYMGGVLDEIIMRITDIFLSLPLIVFALVVTVALGDSVNDFVYALIVVMWPFYARITRSVALSTKNLNYVEAARASGSGTIRNAFVHVLPNSLPPALIQMSLDLGTVVLLYTTLFFLNSFFLNGLIFAPELGNLIAVGAANGYLFTGVWWAFFFPGLFLLFFIVGTNLLGDGLRDLFDPSLRS